MLIVLIFGSAHAGVEIPEGVKVLTAPEVREMVARNEALFVHVLSQVEYQMQHIPGSINIPVDQLTHSPKMPVDKDSPIIFYCNGLACPYSRRASKLAVQQGYTQIHWFRGGILEWRKFQYPMEVDKVLSKIKVPKLAPAKFEKIARNEGTLIVDVRPRWWRESKEKAGVIAGTEIMIPLIDLSTRYELLPKARPILLVDRLMRQSVHAAKFLKSKGYNVVGVLKGGTKRWVAEGFPTLARKDEPRIADGS